MYIGCVKFEKRWVGYHASPVADAGGGDPDVVVYQVAGSDEAFPTGRILSRDRWVRRLKANGYAVHRATVR